jgi:hypothetical protein
LRDGLTGPQPGEVTVVPEARQRLPWPAELVVWLRLPIHGLILRHTFQINFEPST